jgi:hypothetical protein
MAFIYDNLVATLIATTVVLILISVQMRATSANVAQVGRSAALGGGESFATWVEQDLEAMGRHVSVSETVFSSPVRQANGNSPTGEVLEDLTFYYRTDEGSPKTTITYEVTEVDTQTIGSEKRTLYQLSRSKNGTDAGGSPVTLGYFDVRFLNRTAGVVTNPTANRSKIEALRAHFSVVSPIQNDETKLQEVHRMVVVPYTPALE